MVPPDAVRGRFGPSRPVPRMGHLRLQRHLPHMMDVAVHDAPARETTVRLAAQGDEAAFTRLVSEHRDAMARVAFVICGDSEATRDAVQAAWTIAWRRLHTLRDPEQVRPWLIAIAANEARQVIRGRRRRPVIDISDAVHPFSHIFFNPHLSVSHGFSLMFLAAFAMGDLYADRDVGGRSRRNHRAVREAAVLRRRDSSRLSGTAARSVRCG